MSLSARAVAVGGIGFGARLVAVQGLRDYSTTPVIIGGVKHRRLDLAAQRRQRDDDAILVSIIL